MFILHSSNKTENLLAHLVAVLEAAPPASPLAPEVLIIQSLGMERWLSQQLAGHFRVWANFRFLFPQKFFNGLAQSLRSEPAHMAFERGPMLWHLESLLRTVQQNGSDDDACGELRHYLTGENSELKRYQLARQLTRLFDQYQIFRPDLLAAWRQDRRLYDDASERWQQALWRRIVDAAGPNHRGVLWQNAAARLRQLPAAPEWLPERISVFGLNTMPPLFLDILQGLSKHCQVHLFMLNPSQGYWTEPSVKRRPGDESPAGVHPLLAALGQQGREFYSLLLEQIQFDLEPASFEPNETPNNLQQLQNDLLTNGTDPLPLRPDGSLSFHACHSRRREIEVLKDLLLDALAADPELQLRDIAVMAPDIQVYEPFIGAVFYDIQHAVADRSLGLNNRLLDAFGLFLEISQSRFGWRSVLDLLESPDVYPVFGLADHDLALIRHWQQKTEVRWGKSKEHMRELDLPETGAHTWQNMIERLLMGYAAGHDSDFVSAVLPYKEVEGSAAVVQGGLWAFLRLLFEAGGVLCRPKPLGEWSLCLQQYAERLFGNPGTPDYHQLNELFAELAADGGGRPDPVDASVIGAWLRDRIGEQASAHGFLRGQLTFCSILPMRSLPFRIIALIGMNEGEFPKIDRSPSFDLIARHFRSGDRSRRTDDRYQFLEILLSARERLIITYLGQSSVDNAVIPPSIAVSELLQALADQYGLDHLVVRHPLQPFSRRYFEATGAVFSYSEDHYRIACALAGPKPAKISWWPLDHAEPDPNAPAGDRPLPVELDDLFAFFRHPQRFFLCRQMDLHLASLAADREEREYFKLSYLDHYRIDHEWLDALIAGRPFSLPRLQALGCWLPHAPGELLYERRLPPLREFANKILSKKLGAAVEPISVDLTVGGCRLIGRLHNCYQHGGFYFRYADLKGKDFVQALLHHLILQRLRAQPTHLLSKDADLVFRPDCCPSDNLAAWLDIYRQGRQSPHVFFVEAAFDYVRRLSARKAAASISPEACLKQALEKIQKTAAQSYEHEFRRLYAGMSDPLNNLPGEAFIACCETLMLPAWKNSNGG